LAATQASILEGWQHHVLVCNQCGSAMVPDNMCQMGKNFWRVPGSASFPIPAPAQPVSAPYPGGAGTAQPYYQPAPSQGQTPNQVVNVSIGGGFDMTAFSSRVFERVVARSSSGMEVAVPMEKTSRLTTFQTAPNVVMQMPERDIEVYASMNVMVQKYLRFANRLGTYMTTVQESKRMGREVGVVIDENQTQAIVAQVASHQRMGSLTPEQLYDEFSDMTNVTIQLADLLGRFMAVDTDTRSLMREARSLGVDMQGELERSIGCRLAVDEHTPKIVRQMRMMAVSLKGEMERRLGTA
jgi:hypothetical protein